METEINNLREDVKKLMVEVALIKSTLFNEVELTDWAETELKKAREEQNYTSLEEL
jgi:hypothetical protein